MLPPATFQSRIETFWSALGGDPGLLDHLGVIGPRHCLPSPFDVTGLAVGSIGAALLAVLELGSVRARTAVPSASLHSLHASLAFRSEHYLRPIGFEMAALWDPIAGDYECADGFIRLHTNYAHHRDAALRVLGVPAEREAVAEVVRTWEGERLESEIRSGGGCAAVYRSADQWSAHPIGRALSTQLLVERRLLSTRAHVERRLLSTQTPVRMESRAAEGRSGDEANHPRRTVTEGRHALPLSGIRVLDLTRVIAGPVGTRFLAAYGADVLRIDPPGFEEHPVLLLDATAGKRRAFLDLRTTAGKATLAALLEEADVLVHGLRPDALPRLGFDFERLAREFPHLVRIGLSAYGDEAGASNWRGFDSLVQMATGIARRGQEVYATPGPKPLPAQALDYSTGYLAAAATCRALTDRISDGAVTVTKMSLARMAQHLASLGEVGDVNVELPSPTDIEPFLENAETQFGEVWRVRLPGSIDGVAPSLDIPAGPLGVDPPGFPDTLR